MGKKGSQKQNGEGCRTVVNNITETKGEEFYRWNDILVNFYTDFQFISTSGQINYCISLFLNECDIVEGHKVELDEL